MPTIELTTIIKSSIEICFDLSRSIDLHQISTAHTKEKAISGKISGLIGLGESVTWQAKHLGITQKLTSKISAYNRPFHFRDEQIKGVFKYIVHDHNFEVQADGVVMTDIFRFRSPAGFAGRIIDKLFLKGYLKSLLIKRNEVIKDYAETLKWKSLL